MDYKKKLKIRLYTAITFAVIGIAMMVLSFILENANEFLSPYGLALFVIGCVRIKEYFRITKNESTLKNREIAETDERNIAISNKAKSFAFTLYIVFAAIAVIVLEILKMADIAALIGSTVCVLILIYWISYFIIRKKS